MKKLMAVSAVPAAVLALATFGAGGMVSVADAAVATPAASTQVLKLSANPKGLLSYNTKTLTAAKAGKVTIEFTNKSSTAHNVTVEQKGKKLGATPTFAGGTRSLTLNLKAGKYTYYCSVPGHRQAGMVGTLTVK